MQVLTVEPGRYPVLTEIREDLASMQDAVGGNIEAVYPFSDDVALVCNEEGKLNGLPLNRSLKDGSGRIYDIIAGTFFLCGLSPDNFASLSPELAEKYEKHFHSPEKFYLKDGHILSRPMEEEGPVSYPFRAPRTKQKER